MEHSYFKDRISAFHDNELKHEEERMIAEHLETCSECQQLLEKLRKFDGMVEKHSGLADDEYWEKSARKIEAAIGGESVETEVTEVEPSSWKGLGWKLAGVAASLAVIAFIALYEGEISDKVREDMPPDARAMRITLPPSPDSLADAEVNQIAMELTEQPDSEGDLAPARETLAAKVDRAPSPVIGIPKPVGDEAVVDSEADYFQSEREELAVVISEPSEIEEALVLEDEMPEAPQKSTIKVEKGKTHVVTEMEKKVTDLGMEIVVRAEERLVVRDKTSSFVIKRDSDAVVSKEAISSSPMDIALRGGANEIDTLQMWRDKRDSLETVVNRLVTSQVQRVEGKKKITATAADQRELKEMVDSISAEISWRDPQLLLLESHFEIARLTEDKAEYDASVQYLKDYLGRENVTFKLHAAWYLQQLGESE